MERDFRTLKTGHLEFRPWFVCTADNTQAHALTSMLALKVRRHLERAWWPLEVTVEEGLRELEKLCVMELVHPQSGEVVARQVPEPTRAAKATVGSPEVKSTDHGAGSRSDRRHAQENQPSAQTPCKIRTIHGFGLNSYGTSVAGETARVLCAEGAPAYRRRPRAGEALALRPRRQTAGSHRQLDRLPGQQLSEAQTRPAQETPRRAVAFGSGSRSGRPNPNGDNRGVVVLPRKSPGVRMSFGPGRLCAPCGARMIRGRITWRASTAHERRGRPFITSRNIKSFLTVPCSGPDAQCLSGQVPPGLNHSGLTRYRERQPPKGAPAMALGESPV